MEAKLFNLTQIRDQITTEITEYKELIRSEVSNNQLISFFDNLLIERELLLNEIDYRRETRDYGQYLLRKNQEFQLMINEIDESTYNDFLSLSYKIKLPVGELISFLMNKTVERFNGKSFPQLSAKVFEYLRLKQRKNEISIINIKKLTVNQSDLIEMDCKVSFSNIEFLEFEEDVQLETFVTKVSNIINCTHLRVPQAFSKLLVYSKAIECDNFEFCIKESISKGKPFS